MTQNAVEGAAQGTQNSPWDPDIEIDPLWRSGSPTSNTGQLTGPQANAHAGHWTRREADGQTTEGFGMNAEATTLVHDHTDRLGNSEQTRGPDAQATLGLRRTTTRQGGFMQEAGGGATANVASRSVRTGNETTNARLGVSAGIGYGARVRGGDVDNDGNPEIGFGIDLGPLSFDANVEIPMPDGGRTAERNAIEARERAWGEQNLRDIEEANRTHERERDAALAPYRTQEVVPAPVPAAAAPTPAPAPAARPPSNLSEEGELFSQRLANATPEQAAAMRAALAHGSPQPGGRMHVTVPGGGIYELASRDLTSLRRAGSAPVDGQLAANRQSMAAAHRHRRSRE